MKIKDYCARSHYRFLHPFKLACYRYGLPELELRMNSEAEYQAMAIKDGSPLSAVIACCCYYGSAMRAAAKIDMWSWGASLDDYPMQKAAVEWLKKQLPGWNGKNFVTVMYGKRFNKLIEDHDFFWMHPDRISKSSADGYALLRKCEYLAARAAESTKRYEIPGSNGDTPAIQFALSPDYTDEAADVFIPSLRLMLSDAEELSRRRCAQNAQD